MITLFYQMGLSYWIQKWTRLKLRVHVPVPNSELTSQSRAQFPVFRVPSKFPRLLPVAWRRLCAQMPPLAPSRVSCRVFVIFRIPRIILISIKKNRQTCVNDGLKISFNCALYYNLQMIESYHCDSQFLYFYNILLFKAYNVYPIYVRTWILCLI